MRGRDLDKWRISYKNYYIIIVKYGEGEFLENNYPSIYNYLSLHENKLKNRGQVKVNQHHWLELDNNPSSKYIDLFKKEKLIYPNIANGIYPVYDNSKFFTNQKCFIMTSKTINLKYLNGLLASNVSNFIFSLIGSNLGKKGYDINKIFVEQLPIILDINNEKNVIDKLDNLINFNQQISLYESNIFKYMNDQLNISKLSKKLEKFYMLSEREFLNEIKKKNKNFDEIKILKIYNHSKINIISLLKKIENEEKELNQYIYKIYNLNGDDIKILENHIN